MIFLSVSCSNQHPVGYQHNTESTALRHCAWEALRGAATLIPTTPVHPRPYIHPSPPRPSSPATSTAYCAPPPGPSPLPPPPTHPSSVAPPATLSAICLCCIMHLLVPLPPHLLWTPVGGEGGQTAHCSRHKLIFYQLPPPSTPLLGDLPSPPCHPLPFHSAPLLQLYPSPSSASLRRPPAPPRLPPHHRPASLAAKFPVSPLITPPPQ